MTLIDDSGFLNEVVTGLIIKIHGSSTDGINTWGTVVDLDVVVTILSLEIHGSTDDLITWDDTADLDVLSLKINGSTDGLNTRGTVVDLDIVVTGLGLEINESTGGLTTWGAGTELDVVVTSLDLDTLDVVSTKVGKDLEGLDGLGGADRSDGLDGSDRLDGFNELGALETLDIGGILRGRAIKLGDGARELNLGDDCGGSRSGSILLGTALLLRRLAGLVLVVGVLAHVLGLTLSCLVKPPVLDGLGLTVPGGSNHTRCDLLA